MLLCVCSICFYKYACIHSYIQTHTHIFTHTRIYIHTYVHHTRARAHTHTWKVSTINLYCLPLIMIIVPRQYCEIIPSRALSSSTLSSSVKKPYRLWCIYVLRLFVKSFNFALKKLLTVCPNVLWPLSN